MDASASTAVVPITIVDEGLGNTCHLLDLGDGSALVVDPPRDLRTVVATAREHGLRIRFAADTHLHADFLSGAAQLAHEFGTTVLASAAGRRAFEHRGLAEGDQVDLGGLRLTALATPGHTDEHLSFLLGDGERPVGVFTGGSLIVGSAARTDLLGRDRTEALTRAQFHSLQRLGELPARTAVWPTHGAGSFCSAPPGAERTSTIGQELATNPLLQVGDEDAFVQTLLDSLGSYPTYFRRLTEINRRGPQILDLHAPARLAPLSPSLVRTMRGDGAVVVDVRPVRDYAAGHVRGAISIPLREQFATWLGWLVDDRVVIVRGDDQDPAEIVWAAANIGFDAMGGLAGELAGGVESWAAAGYEVATTGMLAAAEVEPDHHHVLDVRQDAELATGHLPRARHIELGSLPAETVPHGDGSDPRVVTMCGHGERAATAASLLERQGHRDLAIVEGGPDDWARARGDRLDTTS